MNQEPIEQWVECLPHHAWSYEVSSFGRVRFKSPKKSWRIKYLQVDTCGYSTIRVGPKKGYKMYRVHVLVAKAFIENPFGKPEVNHKDGVKSNNAVSNLEWVTGEENNAHAISIGLNAPPKIGPETAIEVLELRKKGLTNRQIATALGLTFKAVTRFFESKTLRKRNLEAIRSPHDKSPLPVIA